MDGMNEIRKALDETFGTIKKEIDGVKINLIDTQQKIAGLSESGVRSSGSRGESLGALAAKSDLLMQWANGNGARTVRIALDSYDAKADAAAITSANYPIPPAQQLMQPIALPRLWTSLASLPVSSNAMETITGDLTNNGGYQIPEGSLKPQSSTTFATRLWPVVTVAHWQLASRQVLDDAPMLRGFVDSTMVEGLNEVIDREVLLGSGEAGHLLGLVPGGTAADSTAGDNPLDGLLYAVAALQAQGARNVTVAVNPLDLVALAILKDNAGAYLMDPLQPLSGVYGSRFVAVSAIPRGTWCATASPMGAFVGLRQGITLEVSREDADNFRRNMVTILVECRIALILARPELILHGTFSEPAIAHAPAAPAAKGK